MDSSRAFCLLSFGFMGEVWALLFPSNSNHSAGKKLSAPTALLQLSDVNA